MSEALQSILGCEAVPITITEYKYPSSYAKTCDVGGDEIKENARPKIEAIKALVPDADVIETISIYCDDIPKSKELLLDWFEKNKK